MTDILIQCDFDDTITYKDISFLLLDAFAGVRWREYLEKYRDGQLSVGQFSRLSFSLVKATRREMLKRINNRVVLRPGFQEFAGFCRDKDYRLVVVSNGLDFYIEEILKSIGFPDIEQHAAETQFGSEGLKVRYVNADGIAVDDDFKLSWVKKFRNEGYRVTYIGDGNSDFIPAQQCQHIFATASLLRRCRQNNIDCIPFEDFHDIIQAMKSW